MHCLPGIVSQCVDEAPVLQCVAVCCMCCSEFHCVAVSCSVLQCDVLQCVDEAPVWQCVAVRCSVLQCVVVCCSVLQ